jgi:hypothetical protein
VFESGAVRSVSLPAAWIARAQLELSLWDVASAPEPWFVGEVIRDHPHIIIPTPSTLFLQSRYHAIIIIIAVHVIHINISGPLLPQVVLNVAKLNQIAGTFFQHAFRLTPSTSRCSHA